MDHNVQLLHTGPPKLKSCCWECCPNVLELQQLGVLTTALGSLFQGRPISGEEPFPNTHPDSPLMQLHAIPPCPFVSSQGEEPGTSLCFPPSGHCTEQWGHLSASPHRSCLPASQVKSAEIFSSFTVCSKIVYQITITVQSVQVIPAASRRIRCFLMMNRWGKSKPVSLIAVSSIHVKSFYGRR